MLHCFSKLTIERKLTVLMTLVVAVVLSFGALVNWVFETSKVNGPSYRLIVQGKDLIADILPPPEYIVESYLYAIELHNAAADEAETAKLEKLLSQIRRLEGEYRTRHEFWVKELTNDELRNALLKKAHEPAVEFYRLVNQQLGPACLSGDVETAHKLVHGPITQCYTDHRAAIDEVVALATRQNQELEASVVTLVSRLRYVLVLGLGGVVALMWWVSRFLHRSVSAEQFRLQSMLDNQAAAVMFADMNYKITYVNGAAMKLLKKVEHVLPVKADYVIGQSMEAIHLNVSQIRQHLSEPRNPPFEGRIQIAEELFDFKASAVMGQNGQVVGIMVNWECVTTKVANERKVEENLAREQAQAQELQTKVEQILTVVEAASKGDLTQPVTVVGDDAIGQIGRGLEAFFADMRNRIRTIKENSVALTSASEEFAVTGREMAQNAHETANQANAVSTASEQVNANMNTVSSGIDQMNSSIREIAKSAAEAANVAQRAVGTAQATSTRITKLRESSVEIGNVVNVINSIAEQTKLLALNATIEAARAGEAGKGFAVVANEVKELAKETADATENISKRIEAIQADTTDAVEAIKDICSVVNQINDISNTIASAVEEQTAVSVEIARNASESAAGCGEIARSVSAVAEVAKNTMNGANNSQQAAVELSKMAAELEQLVARFLVEGSSELPPSGSFVTYAPRERATGKYRLNRQDTPFAEKV